MAVRKRQLVVPSLPPLPAATSHGIREAKNAPDSRTPSVRQDPVPPVQPSTAAMRHPPAVPEHATRRQAPIPATAYR